MQTLTITSGNAVAVKPKAIPNTGPIRWPAATSRRRTFLRLAGRPETPIHHKVGLPV